jgi:hypothetical protein
VERRGVESVSYVYFTSYLFISIYLYISISLSIWNIVFLLLLNFFLVDGLRGMMGFGVVRLISIYTFSTCSFKYLLFLYLFSYALGLLYLLAYSILFLLSLFLYLHLHLIPLLFLSSPSPFFSFSILPFLHPFSVCLFVHRIYSSSLIYGFSGWEEGGGKRKILVLYTRFRGFHFVLFL